MPRTGVTMRGARWRSWAMTSMTIRKNHGRVAASNEIDSLFMNQRVARRSCGQPLITVAWREAAASAECRHDPSRRMAVDRDRPDAGGAGADAGGDPDPVQLDGRDAVRPPDRRRRLGR